jgi:hypothetical protein
MASFGLPSLGAVARRHTPGRDPGSHQHNHRPPVCLNHIERFLFINPITKFHADLLLIFQVSAGLGSR